MRVLAALLMVSCFLTVPFKAHSSDDTYVKIQEMVNDLGPQNMRAKNNGKVLKCEDGGTKKITITKSKSGTTYEGVYKNCSEYGRTRGGHVSITIGG